MSLLLSACVSTGTVVTKHRGAHRRSGSHRHAADLGCDRGVRRMAVGGERPGGTYREVEVFDQRTGSWSRGPDLPTPRHGLGVVVVAANKELVGGELRVTPARLLVLTGGPTPGDSQTAMCEALDLP